MARATIEATEPEARTEPRAARARGMRLRELALGVAAGVVSGLLSLAVLLSLAALIFAGPLDGIIASGVGLLLVGTCAMNLVLTLLGTRPPMVTIAQDAPAVIVVLIASGIAASLPAGAPSSAVYATVVAGIALTTLATGAAYLLLGQFRLGSLVRYMPYPVVGGFLAGTGWLLALGGLGVMTGEQPSLATLPALLRPPALWRWLPGVLFGVLILLALRRTRHVLALPGMFVGATALFHLWVALGGAPLAEVQARGWLLGPFPDQVVWSPPTPALLTDVRWGVIAQQTSTIAAAVTICVIGLLLNVSGLQLARREEIDLNRDLRAAGGAQLATGLLGGPPGFQSLSLSMIGVSMGARTRLVGVTAGLLVGAAFFVGAELLVLMPRMVLGGMVFYLGLAFLTEWLYDAWFRLSRGDYALIVGILALVIGFGMLPGVVAGLVIAVVLFVVAYSRVGAVKHELSGAVARSRMTRGSAEQALLRERGEGILILELQGFIFFGTAHELYERVRRRAEGSDGGPALRCVLLDFRLVPRLDSTAMLSFGKIRQLGEARRFTLVCTHLAPSIRRQFERVLLRDGDGTGVRLFPDLDRGLEWCEAHLLADAGEVDGAGRTLRAQLARLAPEAANLDSLLAAFERRELGAGEYLIRVDEPPEAMNFVERGQVTAQLEGVDGGAPVRLETMGAGRTVGELGFYLRRPRTAAVLADEPSAVLRVTRDDLRRLEEDHPDDAATFHLLIARLLSERVVHLVETVEALQR